MHLLSGGQPACRGSAEGVPCIFTAAEQGITAMDSTKSKACALVSMPAASCNALPESKHPLSPEVYSGPGILLAGERR